MILGSLLFVFNLQSSSEYFCQAKTALGMSSSEMIPRGEVSAAGVPCNAPSPSPSQVSALHSPYPKTAQHPFLKHNSEDAQS